MCIKKDKCIADLDFLTSCKKEKLFPSFAQRKFSIKSSKKLEWKIAKLIIEVEIKNKHAVKKKLQKEATEVKSF